MIVSLIGVSYQSHLYETMKVMKKRINWAFYEIISFWSHASLILVSRLNETLEVFTNPS